MAYKIVVKASDRNMPLENAADDLAKEVNDMIRSGWKPRGGTAVTGHFKTVRVSREGCCVQREPVPPGQESEAP